VQKGEVVASKDGPGGYSEPEVGSASGGHLAPDASSGPRYEHLEPSPGPPRREGGSTYVGGGAPERTEVFPRGSAAVEPTPGLQPYSASQGRPIRKSATRRVRRRISHIDPFSVLKISGFFYAIFLLVWLLIVAVLYTLIDAAGFFDAAEDLGQGLVLWDEVNITLGLVEKWAFFVGLLMAVVGTLFNTLLALLYNLASDLLGGLELTFVERDS
jgi:hypothetical protein